MERITGEKLKDYGFQEELQGLVMRLNCVDRHIELVNANGDEWYPQLVQEPEMAHEDRQIVSLPYIEYWHELEDLHKMFIGEELKKQKT